MLREYTAWAVALGAVDRWCAAVRAAGTPIPHLALREAGLAPSLGWATERTIVEPVEVDRWMPSSGGGGFDGGGGAAGVDQSDPAPGVAGAAPGERAFARTTDVAAPPSAEGGPPAC